MAKKKERKANEPRTFFGKWMVNTVIPNYANNVNGIVYMGAAVLIIVVGLRGLGKEAAHIELIPKAMLNDVGSIDPTWVVGAILLEFTLLLMLALVTFFTPEDNHGHSTSVAEGTDPLLAELPTKPKVDLERELNDLRDLTEKEIKMVNEYLDKYEAIAEKISNIQLQSVKAINEMKETIK